ncbi:MAG: TolC family protein [Acidobacteriia bacterium]|nr:TolC family protein [Terriglobia bacterium]
MKTKKIYAAGFAIPVILALAACCPKLAKAQQSPASQTITLPEAVKIALEKNPQRKAALADTRAASADIKEARSFLMPRITFSETAMRGTDPVYVFGSRLRQQRFTTADFALNALNTPTPLGNYATRFGGAWNLFDSLASWRGVDRAKSVQDASTQQLARTEQEIVFRVVDSYYGALLAKKHVELAGQALKTAQAILDRSKDRVESGVAVESDSLSAQVRLAARNQELIGAQNNLEFARAQLSTALGLPAANEFDPAEALAEKNLPAQSLEDAEKKAMESRPDLKRIRSEEIAQQKSVSIAKAAFGPRVNAFADWEADNPAFFSGGGNNWTAGIELQFDLFQGGAKRAELSREQALQEKVASVKEMASDAAKLEVRRAFYDVDAARRQIEVARAAIAAAEESLRINQDRYESGLSTIADLLAAEEAARHSQTDYWEAVYRYHTGYAGLELASGTLNLQSPVVTP